mmetsp:Transcript_8936/g.37535  ORF Transcript_8936/g.37535 Transcript_8936/m.37535 type:complete len:241 (+) Transcript_8936:3928-4650(+)
MPPARRARDASSWSPVVHFPKFRLGKSPAHKLRSFISFDCNIASSSRRKLLGLDPVADGHEPFLLVRDERRRVVGGQDVGDVDALLLRLNRELRGLRARGQDADERRVTVFRVASFGGLPIADEVPRVSGLVLGVEQVVRRDPVLRALRHVLVDASPDARLREADEEHARAEHDRTRRRALGRGEAEISRSGRESLRRHDTARPAGGPGSAGAARAAAERDALGAVRRARGQRGGGRHGE